MVANRGAIGYTLDNHYSSMLAEAYIRKQLHQLPAALSGTLSDPRTFQRLAFLDTLVCVSADLFLAETPRLRRYFAMQDQLASTKERLLATAGSLAASSRRPLHKAVRQAAVESGMVLREAEVESAREETVVARLDRTWYVLGDEASMEAEGIELGVTSRTLTEQLESEGSRMLYLAQKQPRRLLAIFACQSEVIPEAPAFLAALHQAGVETILLTGERTRVAKGIAARIGIRLIHSELAVEEKQAIVRLLQEQHKRAAFAAPRSQGSLVRDTPLPILIGKGVPKDREIIIPSLAVLPELLQASRAAVGKAQKLFFWCKLTPER